MCENIKLDGHNVIICGLRRKRQYCSCGRPCDFLCDWKVPANESGTCDKPICSNHSKQVALGKHLCPEHQLQWDDWQRKHPPAQKSLFGEAA